MLAWTALQVVLLPGRGAAVPAEASPVDGEKASAIGARDGPMSYGYVDDGGPCILSLGCGF
jgi:hypothetical protein